MTTVMMMVVRQQSVLDPSPMLVARIANTAHRPKGCSGCHGRSDLYQGSVSCMTASFQRSTMSDCAECQAPARASHVADSYTRACPRGFLFK